MYLMCFEEKGRNFHFILQRMEEQMYKMWNDYSVTNKANQEMNLLPFADTQLDTELSL